MAAAEVALRRPVAAPTTRQTAGLGFDFEDLVGAWFVSQALSGEPIPGVGALAMIQFQTGALGWTIDDLLLTSEDDPARRLAVSCKSNPQMTAAGWPADFVEPAWALWQNPQGPMDQARDGLALVTRGRDLKFDPAWTEIVTDCEGPDSHLALARIRQTQVRARIFDSVRSPGGIDRGGSDEATLGLVRHLQTIPLDLQLAGSRDLAASIARCRALLVSNDQLEGEALWDELVRLVHKARVGSGGLTVAAVWAALRAPFALRDRPDYEASWRRLLAVSDEHVAAIDLALPTGLKLQRERQVRALADLVREQTVSVVFGESGVGKSALVKSALDEHFPQARQLWLGPDHVAIAVAASTRGTLGLSRPLGETLLASSAATNVLVLDSAERIAPERLTLVRQLIDDLATADWSVVLVTQSEGWTARAPLMLGQRAIRPHEVEALEPQEVRTALWSSSDLDWLADNPHALTALANPKMLAWVMLAPAMSPAPEQLTSPAAVADHIWAFWTGGDLAAQGLLTRLAIREAEFERNFRVSDLDPADAQTVDRGKERIPLRRANNRLEFAHDLASDLARFQRLREIDDDMAAWAPFASNPLWHAALRTFGQFLLREVGDGRTRWDDALAEAETSGHASVVDLLLDALCLDPMAEAFLAERADVLLADHGRLLNRLLGRFLHVATVPGAFGVLSGADSITSLYLQAAIRTPIIGRWPGMARFLHSHLEGVADLMSPTVAAICQLWLTRMPVQLVSGLPTPFRREFAEIALASSRAMQVSKAGGVIFMGDNVELLDAATLAGAEDLPDEVSVWALEMAGRQATGPEIGARIAEAVRRRRAERAAYAAAHPGPDRPAPMPSIPSSRRLPAWPLGAFRRIDRDFRRAAGEARNLAPLMRARPDVAAEVLLALLVNDEPREEYGSSSRFDDDLGLEFSDQAYPTAFWKSPFYPFLQIAPDQALTALIQLIAFCSERWRAEWAKRSRSPPIAVVLSLADGSSRAYYGGWTVFDWAESSSHANGLLYSALSALERWLVDGLESGRDVAPALERLLNETSSLSVVGVLTSLAKLRPALLKTVLMPLLSTADLFELDSHRVDNGGHGGDLVTWADQGELVFETAKAWIFAPHRRRHFRDVVGMALVEEPRAAQVALTAAAALPETDHPDAKLRRDTLAARLDAANYSAVTDPETGVTDYPFAAPDALVQAFAAQQMASGPGLQAVLLAPQLKRVLKGELGINTNDLPALAAFLQPPAAGEDPALAADNAVAVAATLAAVAGDWLAETPQVAAAVKDLLRRGAQAVADDHTGIRSERVGIASTQLEYIAHGVMRLWLREGLDSEWEPLVLGLMTCGSRSAAAVIGWIGFTERERLGVGWWRLMQLGGLWSALSMLAPHYDSDEAQGARWNRWLARFRTLRIAGVDASLDSLDWVRLAERLERLEYDERRRRVAAGRGYATRDLKRYRLAALQTDYLKGLFGWLVADGALPAGLDIAVTRSLLFKFFDYEAQWCAEHGDDEGEYHLPYGFGFDVLDRMAALTAQDHAQGDTAWRAVLALGPAARTLIDHFLTAWFFEKPDTAVLVARWREMITFALGQSWTEGRFWYDGGRLLRALMGFGAVGQLSRRDDAAVIVGSMGDLYRAWAGGHLATDERNIAQYANFLSAPFARSLRIAGLAQFVEMLGSDLGRREWTRDGAGDALLALLDRLLIDDLGAIKADPAARSNLLALAAALSDRKVSAALMLQERAAQLLK
jgi:hypothetical protein